MQAERDKRETVLVIHNTAHYIALHYREFIQSLLHRGYQVQIAAPQDAAFAELESLGARCHDFPLSRRGTNPIRELRSVVYLSIMIQRTKPLIVFNYSIKPVIYGSFAAGLRRVPYVYSMITGLGYMFGDKAETRVMRRIVIALYRHVLKKNTKVFFQNSHDRDVFVQHGILQPDRAVVLNGTGIDLQNFRPGPRKPSDNSGGLVFLLVSRLLWEKGIAEYVSAAEQLKKRYPQSRFQLLGPIDDNPSAITKAQLDEWHQNGAIEYLGQTTDVRPYLRRASVFVLPSYYREGRPRSILEAMAVGKPVITTDWPGCREPVTNGVNGFLVPPKDAEKLCSAMERFVQKPGLVKKMGNASRKIAESDYDVHQVNKKILSYFPQIERANCCVA